MYTDGNPQVFLATTALEEFWDTTKPMVFLGEWCLPYSRRADWERLGGQLLDGVFAHEGAAAEASDYVDEVYERVLPLIGSRLNSIHGANHGERYWRIVLGPWLHIYVSVVYDRYRHISTALSRYPRCVTIGLAREAFVVARDTQDFNARIVDDSFNLQIYTKILTALGRTFRTIGGRSPSTTSGGNPAVSWRQKVVAFVTKMHGYSVGALVEPIVLKSSYFSKSAELGFLANSVGRVLPMWGQSKPLAEPDYSAVRREPLATIWLGESEFERCLAAMLGSDLPKCFLEGYQALCGAADADYPSKVGAIFSANAWYYDETFKHWAATAAANGARLFGTQHGGNYGALARMPSENHETSIVDHYYSWGWEREDCAATVTAMPASKLCGRAIMGAHNSNTGVLWVTTSRPRYLVQFPFLPREFGEYLEWQLRFCGALRGEVMAITRLRPHREECGWAQVERIHDNFPGLPIETWEVPFQSSLAGCRLYVCDHLSTTFVEALAANKPTILYWDRAANELRPEAQSYYELLRQNDILFDSPESAADAVNRVYPDTETWWNAPDRQSAVATFCARFARTELDANSLWAAEFARIAAMPRSPAQLIG